MSGDQGGFVTVTTSTQISLEIACGYADCANIATPLLSQLCRGYETCATMEIPADITDWRDEHRTARKRADRANRRGYTAMAFDRSEHAEEIHRINTSASHRQGMPMSSGYRALTEFSRLPSYPCGRHAIRTTGVFHPNQELVGYLTMYRAGDLALVSQILGHAAYLSDEIMFLLFQCALLREILRGPGVVVYNRWDSGQPGLREFKTRLGFHETEVEWYG